MKLTMIWVMLTPVITAMAAETNHMAQADYSAFRLICERNIFNQHREEGRTKEVIPAGIIDAFSLVGTMSYGKGEFAFFDGTRPDYRSVLRPGGEIGDFKVLKIEPQGVMLQGGGKSIDVKVGMQMRRDEKGAWQVVNTGEVSVVASSPEPAKGGSGGEVNDVLMKLMRQREQELK